MEATKVLALVSLLIYLIAFGLYNRQIISGHSKPNPATWGLWVFLAFLNSASYSVMTGDWVKAMTTYAGCVAMSVTFLFALKKGKFAKLSSFDWSLMSLGFLSILIWWIKRDAMYANLLLQVSVILSFIPTYRWVWHDPRNERPLPWLLFSFGYCFAVAVVVLRWQGQPQDLAFPVLGVVLHAVVGLMSLRRQT